MESAQRLAFADVLRGLASLGVVVGHFLFLPLTKPDLVATITAGVPGEAVAFPAWVNWLIVTFSPPGIGVAVFFLISGFVIPMSLATSTTRAYLLKRFFRIYPPLWVALAITAGAIFVSATYWSKTSPYATADYVANVFLAADLVTRLDVLTVAWTLQIEIKFYLLAIVIHAALARRQTWPLFLFGGAITAIYMVAAAGCGTTAALCWDHHAVTTRFLLWEAMFITFMLIGSLFYAHYARLIGTRHAVLGSLFLFACFQVDLLQSPLPFLNNALQMPYVWGFLIFTSCYMLRAKIRLTGPFRFFADISYPLYLVHPIVGYVAIRLLQAAGLPFAGAFAVAMAFVIGLAAAIHAFVEAPAIALSKRLVRFLDGSRRRSRADAVSVPARP